MYVRGPSNLQIGSDESFPHHVPGDAGVHTLVVASHLLDTVQVGHTTGGRSLKYFYNLRCEK